MKLDVLSLFFFLFFFGGVGWGGVGGQAGVNRRHSMQLRNSLVTSKLVGQISETIFHFWKQAPKLAHILLRYCSFDKTH